MITKSHENKTNNTINNGDFVFIGNTLGGLFCVSLGDILVGESGPVGFNCGIISNKRIQSEWIDCEPLYYDIQLNLFMTTLFIPNNDFVMMGSRADANQTPTDNIGRIWLHGNNAQLFVF